MDIGKHKVLVMRVESKPWQMEGNSGTATTVRFMDEGKVYKAKITPDLYEAAKGLVQVTKVVTLELDAYDEKPRLLCSKIE